MTREMPNRRHAVAAELAARRAREETADQRNDTHNRANDRPRIDREGVDQDDLLDSAASALEATDELKRRQAAMAVAGHANRAAGSDGFHVRQVAARHLLDRFDAVGIVEQRMEQIHRPITFQPFAQTKGIEA